MGFSCGTRVEVCKKKSIFGLRPVFRMLAPAYQLLALSLCTHPCGASSCRKGRSSTQFLETLKFRNQTNAPGRLFLFRDEYVSSHPRSLPSCRPTFHHPRYMSRDRGVNYTATHLSGSEYSCFDLTAGRTLQKSFSPAGMA